MTVRARCVEGAEGPAPKDRGEMQGHLFSAALPAALLEEMLKRSSSTGAAIDVKGILKAEA